MLSTRQHSVLMSILDNDLYKFSMQNAVMKHYNRDIPVVYEFTNREKELCLNKKALEWLKKQIQDMVNLQLTESESEFMSKLSYFDDDYIDFLARFRFCPEKQVKITDNGDGDFKLQVSGNWHETILYEVPLLALISEAYFRFVDTDWNYDGQFEKAVDKARALINHGCIFSEFGTRRRRDFKTQDLVIDAICKTNEQIKIERTTVGENSTSNFIGTSNVFLAMKYDIAPVGTVAHEFFMAVSALEGVKYADRNTLDIWYNVYQGDLGVALTDTFTTEIFLQEFNFDLANKYKGVRHDSGNPMDFIDIIIAHYKKIGIDPNTKIIVFSDSLNVERAIHLADKCHQAGIKSSFGIGTFFTNDFQKASNHCQKSKPMNIVIKMNECVGKRVVKLSDDPQKHSPDNTTIEHYKSILGIHK